MEEYKEPEPSGIFRIAKNIALGSPGTHFMHMRVKTHRGKVIKILNKEIPRGGSRAAVNYYHKVLHLGCCSSPRSASDTFLF